MPWTFTSNSSRMAVGLTGSAMNARKAARPAGVIECRRLFGRRSCCTDVDMVTRVVASSLGRLRRHEPEYAAIVELTRSPLSVAEIAARLHLPITATKLLVGDLIGDGVLDIRAPAVGPGSADDLTVLRAVLKGIQAL